MAMNFAVNGANWGLTQILPLFNGGQLTMYNNPQPATPETALAATNTALCTFTFSAAAFGALNFSGGNDQATAGFVATSVTPGANGTVTFARATIKAVPWTLSTAYLTLFTIVSNSANFYVLTRIGTAAGSGGPSGTSAGVNVIDGGASWMYYSTTATQNNVISDFDVGTSGTAIIIGSTAVTTTVYCAAANDNVAKLSCAA